MLYLLILLFLLNQNLKFMPKFNSLLLLLFTLSSASMQSQKKTLQAKSITENITVDGKINEEIWKSAPIATDFVMYQPDNGKPIADNKKTEVKVLYDNDAIYVSALLYDNEPSKIAKEITKRDVDGNSDSFGVFINGNNDGQQDYQFFVSASGIQIDVLSTETTDDYSWDAVWDSSVKITDFGWVVEMKIPYAALRFPNSKKQTWEINFYRSIKRDNQMYTWNFINTNIASFKQQYGKLEGIENINPPTRLFFIPYSSYYYENNYLGANNKLKAGLDIKYGINDAFTVDAILVPDFGQTKFDNAVLNLTPFEQVYNENRPFFTEGTDLFSKGNLFYSRRIGQKSKFKPALEPDEEVKIYPTSVDLLNALKVSGRTKNGLGIGVLNAVTKKTFETVQNTMTNETRKIEIEPLTNYNILVLDQRFRKNSSISFVNTNVTRNGDYRDANVSAIVLDLNSKKNRYNFSGDFKYSSIRDIVDYDGFKSSLYFTKTSGKYRFSTAGRYFSKNYDINDLGLVFNKNYYGINQEFSYRIINPTKVFNSFSTKLIGSFDFQNITGKLQAGFINYNMMSTVKNNDQLNFDLKYSPFQTFGFYQLRKYNRYSYTPQYFSSSLEYIVNPNNIFGISLKPYITKFNEEKRITYGALINPRYRFSDKFSINYLFEYENQLNDVGYIDKDNSNFYFAKRNIQTVNNEFNAKYSLNNKMNINLTGRYYWSFSENKEILTLQNNGYFSSYSVNSTDTSPYNENFNSWNMDLSFSWWFAPASQISFLYRNNAIDYRNIDIEKKLGNNLHNLFNNNLDDIFSISLRYFIDYNSLKN
jgi:hypothetical protein